MGGALVVLMTWDSFAPKKDHPVGSSADVIEITGANWQKEVVESKIPVVVDFGATWCAPCRALAPTIDALATRYKGKVKVGKVDVDNDPEISAKYGIQGIPHVIIFNGGEKPRKRMSGGVLSETTLVKAIDGILAE